MEFPLLFKTLPTFSYCSLISLRFLFVFYLFNYFKHNSFKTSFILLNYFLNFLAAYSFIYLHVLTLSNYILFPHVIYIIIYIISYHIIIYITSYISYYHGCETRFMKVVTINLVCTSILTVQFYLDPDKIWISF